MLTLKEIDKFCKSGKFYLKLDLPVIPEELLPRNFNLTPIFRDRVLDYGADHHLNNVFVKPPLYSIYSYHNTVALNFIENVIEFPYSRHRVIYITTENYNNGKMLPHTDSDRKFAINYFIETGGENVITSWYKEKSKPIYDRHSVDGHNKQVNIGTILKYEDLELLDSVKCQKNKWYIIRTDVIHDVVNLNGIRTMISIGLQ
jgi:hypothetical protein